MPKIRPISDLRNKSHEISRICHDSGEPVYITKNGEDELDINFSEIRYGLTLGGPIVKDKVHFFVSLEGLDATTPSSVGPAGSGAANEVANVSIAEVARAQEIARRVYGFDAGQPSQSLDENDLKMLVKQARESG